MTNRLHRTLLSRRAFFAATFASAFLLVLRSLSAAELSADDIRQTAFDAYVYGYPLITTEVTRVQMSNVAKVEALRAPTGTFFNVRGYPPATYRGVSGTDADTLYSVAWLDLSEPQISQRAFPVLRIEFPITLRKFPVPPK